MIQQHAALLLAILGVLLTGVGVIVALLQLRKNKEPSAIPNVTQSQVVNVNLHKPFAVQEPKKKPAIAASLSAEEIEQGRPDLHSLEPRISFVVDEGDGFIEGGDVARAVLATFRMRKSSADRRGTHVTARLTYKTTTDMGGRTIWKEFLRVNYGTWIDEDFNSVTFTLTDTKELILAWGAGETFVAIQDNRHSLSKQKEPSLTPLDEGEFLVLVTLVDEIYGPLITYTYKIQINPLKVVEIIRFPR